MQTYRDKLRDIYNQYDFMIQLVLKFAVAMFVFVEISNQLGYMEMLNESFVLVILAIICAILPWNGMVVISVFMIVLHCFGLGLEVGAVAAVLFLIMLLFYFRLVPGDAFALMLMPVSFQLGIPAVVPLGLGLLKGTSSAIATIFGVIASYFVMTVNGPVALLKAGGDASLVEVVQGLVNSLFQNTEMYLCIIASVAACLLVSVIRKYIVVHAGLLAAVFGGCVYLAVMLLGGIFTGCDLDLIPQLINVLISVVIVLVLDVLVFSMDYSGSKRLQFEDDDYYYYVKIVPKQKSSGEAGNDAEPEQREQGGSAARKGRGGRPEQEQADAEEKNRNRQPLFDHRGNTRRMGVQRKSDDLGATRNVSAGWKGSQDPLGDTRSILPGQRVLSDTRAVGAQHPADHTRPVAPGSTKNMVPRDAVQEDFPMNRNLLEDDQEGR